MAKYNFAVGDKVQFKEWDELADEFGFQDSGDIDAPGAFVKGMRYLCGQVATIKDIDSPHFRTVDDFEACTDDPWRSHWSLHFSYVRPYEEELDEPDSDEWIRVMFGGEC